MSTNLDFNNTMLPAINKGEAHLPVLLLLDISGSMAGQPIKKLIHAVNLFIEDICKDPMASEIVETCVVTYNDKVKVIQDWRPIKQMQPINLEADGGTMMGQGLEVAVEKLKERGHYYEEDGIPVRIPYLVVITDGMSQDDVTGIGTTIKQRISDKCMRCFFLGVSEYDRKTAFKITDAVFEVKDPAVYDFKTFFDAVNVSLKAASRRAPGEKTIIEDEDNPLLEEDCSIRIIGLNDVA